MTAMSDDSNKLTAKRMVERIDKQSAFVAAEFGIISRWLTASLFALNGGGAAAFLNSHDGASARILPVGLFGAGVIFAMFNAMVVQEMYQSLAELLRRQDSYWSRVAINGRRLRWAESRFKTSRKRRYRCGWLAPAMGWISGVLFVGGITAIALG